MAAEAVKSHHQRFTVTAAAAAQDSFQKFEAYHCLLFPDDPQIHSLSKEAGTDSEQATSNDRVGYRGEGWNKVKILLS